MNLSVILYRFCGGYHGRFNYFHEVYYLWLTRDVIPFTIKIATLLATLDHLPFAKIIVHGDDTGLN